MGEDCYGWTGKILQVDLTRKTASVETWDRSWIGGKAFGQWALFNEEPVGSNEHDQRRVYGTKISGLWFYYKFRT